MSCLSLWPPLTPQWGGRSTLFDWCEWKSRLPRGLHWIAGSGGASLLPGGCKSPGFHQAFCVTILVGKGGGGTGLWHPVVLHGWSLGLPLSFCWCLLLFVRGRGRWKISCVFDRSTAAIEKRFPSCLVAPFLVLWENKLLLGLLKICIHWHFHVTSFYSTQSEI